MIETLQASAVRFNDHPALLHRPARERFCSRLGWLQSWHSFSFANHYDPSWTGFGPLVVLNDDTVAPGTGFGWHPHRHMEIVSVLIEGELTHRDSLGHAQTLRAGEVQVISAGDGIIHSEWNEADRPCRFLQIWIEPESRRHAAPAYDQRACEPGPGWTPLISRDPEDGAMTIRRSVRLWRASPSPGQTLTLPLAAGSRAWVQLIDGAVEVAGEATRGRGSSRLEKGDGLGFRPGVIHSLTAADAAADLLLFELR